MSEVQIPVTEELNITHQHVGVGVGAPEVGVIERRKPPLGAVFLVFDLRRALLGAG